MLSAYDGAGLEGALVEISGVGCEVEPYFADPAFASSWPAIPVDGEHGRCVAWSDEYQRYFVQLFNGLYVLIDRECLAPWEPPPPEAPGGFDLAWPAAPPGEPIGPEQVELLASELAEALAQKGWCLVQLPLDEASRAVALEQARSLPGLRSPKQELAVDFLGRGGSGIVSVLEPVGDGGATDDDIWALADVDSQLTFLARALAPYTAERLGFRSRGRRKGTVWVPFASAAEERRKAPERLSQEDVEAGVLESHLEFIRSRRLCLSAWIENDGGEFTLEPRADALPGAEPIVLPLSAGKLLVYRCDLLGHSCRPATRTAVSLTTWVLDDELDQQRQRLAAGSFGAEGLLSTAQEGEVEQALGILRGPPLPVGFRTHVMAIHAHSPCAAHGSEPFGMIFLSGGDGYEKIPVHRFDVDVYCTMPGEEKVPWKSYVSHAAMIDTKHLELFDNEFFGISNEEAKFVAPGQRLVLQDGYATLHKAGFTKQSLRGRSMGAYCGDTGSEFNSWGQLSVSGRIRDPTNLNVGWLAGGGDKPYGKLEASPFMQAGVMSVVTANRLSHCLGMIGGVSSVDTACSASLVGVSVAVQSFRRAEGEQLNPCVEKHNEDALCVGISCLLAPIAFIALCGPSMLSPGGRCFTFDRGASGYARGDGFAGAYLRPSSAPEDSLEQVACLLGCAVNQDGRSATLTAPNGMAQQACIRASMKEADIVANQITIGECHGTGTALGDPIEVGAYRGVMEPRESPCLATSAKSNIGHLECCAGLTGLLKCCVLVGTSCASPNVHLNVVNPHLDIQGFPMYFETEHADTGLNSNYAGVSSFGFSGTNARADVWGRCSRGAHRAASAEASQLEALVQCPVTLGFMDLLTGENVGAGGRRLLRGEAKAGVLRDAGASYDISRHAYEGGFRYRGEGDEVGDDEDLDPFVGVFISGTWTAFTEMEEMERLGGGWFAAKVVLGETRCERFRLCLNESPDLEIYPVVDHAAAPVWIEGPDAEAGERSWCIDGRDLELPSGTVFEVRFKWHPERKRVEWRPLPTSAATKPSDLALPGFRHGYSLFGTFSAERFLEMAPSADGGWQGSFRIGTSGMEEFQIARDGDFQQIIYPARPRTSAALADAVPVRGPDHLHAGKRWLVRGASGEVVVVRLRVEDARVSVAVASSPSAPSSSSAQQGLSTSELALRSEKRWTSLEGWARHSYAVVGSWPGVEAPCEMALDREAGVFKLVGQVSDSSLDPSSGLYVEAFQIVVDEDLEVPIYPQMDGADSAESIVLGPGGDSRGRSWAVASMEPGARFEVRYDPRAADRRKVVTWHWLDQTSLTG